MRFVATILFVELEMKMSVGPRATFRVDRFTKRSKRGFDNVFDQIMRERGHFERSRAMAL